MPLLTPFFFLLSSYFMHPESSMFRGQPFMAGNMTGTMKAQTRSNGVGANAVAGKCTLTHLQNKVTKLVWRGEYGLTTLVRFRLQPDKFKKQRRCWCNEGGGTASSDSAQVQRQGQATGLVPQSPQQWRGCKAGWMTGHRAKLLEFFAMN